MGTEIALRNEAIAPRSVKLTNEQLQYISRTEFVPPGLRGNLPAILACVSTGRELGIGDMVALKQIHIIDGKATFSAELMVQLVRKRGHSITGEVDDGSASVTGTRADNGDTMTSTWTLAMAERAGLLNKGNWKKYPEAMLWARAASQLCRMLFADCFAGGTYTPEELSGDDDEVAEFDEISSSEPAARDDGNALPVAGSDASVEGPSGDETAAPLDAATPAAEEPSSAEPPSAVELATDAQQTLMVTKASKAGLDDDARHALVTQVTGQPSTKAVPKALVNDVLAAIDAQAAA